MASNRVLSSAGRSWVRACRKTSGTEAARWPLRSAQGLLRAQAHGLLLLYGNVSPACVSTAMCCIPSGILHWMGSTRLLVSPRCCAPRPLCTPRTPHISGTGQPCLWAHQHRHYQEFLLVCVSKPVRLKEIPIGARGAAPMQSTLFLGDQEGIYSGGCLTIPRQLLQGYHPEP